VEAGGAATGNREGTGKNTARSGTKLHKKDRPVIVPGGAGAGTRQYFPDLLYTMS
jgi:hypothetical protein